MHCWPNGECYPINIYSLFKRKTKNIKIISIMCVLIFFWKCTIQTDLRGECDLKTSISYQFVYVEPIVKYWEKEWVHGWRWQMEMSGRHNYYWRCEKLGKLLYFLLCLVCYLHLDKTVLVLHYVHRTHLDEILCLNIIFLYSSGVLGFIYYLDYRKVERSINERRRKIIEDFGIKLCLESGSNFSRL